MGTAAIIALFAGTAYAQSLSLFPIGQDGKRRLSPEEQQKQDAIDRDYAETIKKIPDGKAGNDPWGNVRSAPGKTSSTAKSTVKAKQP